MGTLNEKLDYLKETKSQIKEAIISKGQEVSSSDTFRSYASKISAINTVNNEDLTVNPMTSVQAFTPTQGHTGFGEVNVNAVTSAIDSNIQAGNIKQGVEILGVTGEYEGAQINNQDKTVTTNGTYTADSGYTGLGTVTVNLPLDSKTITVNGTYNASSDELEGYSSVTVNVADVPAVVESLSITPSTSQQTFTPGTGVDGYAPVNVSAVDSTIDNNITAENIRSGVEILGVEGTYEGTVINNQNKSVIPSAIEQQITADSGYTGLGTVTVSGDSDLVSENIKSGVNIFGVVGNVVESNNTTTTITPTTSLQMITPDSPYNGFSSVTVDAVTNSIDENITAGNIKKDVTILGVTGTLEEGPQINNQNISVTTDGTYTAEQGYTGLGTVTVTAGAIASSETENQIAEQLMLINDGQTTFTLNVTPVDAEVLLVSTTNSVNITPTSSSDGTYVYDISMDSSKSYSYSVSKTGYKTQTGVINSGTSQLSIVLQ